jgi:hypothetical protein
MASYCDSEATSRFRDRLCAILDSRVLSPQSGFCCGSASACMESMPAGWDFAAGQLSYVGDGYARVVDGVPYRVLVVSMQVGDTEAPVTMARRAEQISRRRDQPFSHRNPHMRGVTLALQVLHDLPPRPECELTDDGVHVLDAYAMANSTLCSALPTGGTSRRGKPTNMMVRRCGVHLRSTVEALEPTVIHTQGRPVKGASPESALRAIADDIEDVDEFVRIVTIGDVAAVWCSLAHPSSGPPQAWSWPTTSYFTQIAAPALTRTRHLALGR